MDLWSLSTFVLFSLIFWRLRYHWYRRKLYKFALKLPGPFAYPLVGNALKFLCKKEDLLNVFLQLTTHYPSPSRLWIGPRLVMFVKDPDQLQIIFQSPKFTSKARFYRILEPFLGQGLVTASNSLHKRHRKLIQPLFSQKMVEGYSHLFQKHAHKFVDKIKHHVGGEEFDIMKYLPVATFEAIMDVILEDSNSHSIDYNVIPYFIKRFYYIGWTRFRTFWLHPDFLFQRTSLYTEQQKLRQMTTTMINEIMDTTVAKILERVESGGQCEEARVPSILEMLILMVQENPDTLTLQQCTDHLMTLIGASHDTTNVSVAFTCMMLGAHPEKQNLVIQEMKEVLGNRKTLDVADVSKLKYLEMCIKEAMRLFPPVPVVFRDTLEEFQLGNLTVPEDVTLGLSIFHVHKDPKLWEKPEEFYPEHFSAEASSKRHPYAYIPFAAGPRKCLAPQYSYTNLKILVGTLLLNYEIECRQKVEDIKLNAEITLKPVIDGYFVKLKKRLL